MDRLQYWAKNDQYEMILKWLRRKSSRKARNVKRLNRYIMRWWYSD